MLYKFEPVPSRDHCTFAHGRDLALHHPPALCSLLIPYLCVCFPRASWGLWSPGCEAYCWKPLGLSMGSSQPWPLVETKHMFYEWVSGDWGRWHTQQWNLWGPDLNRALPVVAWWPPLHFGSLICKLCVPHGHSPRHQLLLWEILFPTCLVDLLCCEHKTGDI